ncbi:MAG: 3-isopropylmalate dehydratase [Chloroflexota bacterium]
MALTIEGKVWKFGDNTSTDYMMPGFTRGTTPEETAAYCMKAIRPEFSATVRPGDGLVGGRNFGCGSSRPAAMNLLTLGVGCVIAESFGRIFFRNSINLGFPVMICKGVHDAFNEGDRLQANFDTGEVKNLTTGKALKAETLPEVAMKILSAGGIVPLLKEEYGSADKAGEPIFIYHSFMAPKRPGQPPTN